MSDSEVEVSAQAEAPKATELSNLSAEPSSPSERPELEAILEIQVRMSVEIGRAKMSIRSLLGLTQGAVVELDRMAGEPLDVLVNNTLIARGEVVVVGEKFGIRFTDVVSTAERLKRLS